MSRNKLTATPGATVWGGPCGRNDDRHRRDDTPTLSRATFEQPRYSQDSDQKDIDSGYEYRTNECRR